MPGVNSGLAFIAYSASPRAGREWPGVWLSSPRISAPKMLFAGRHTVLNSRSPANTSEPCSRAAPPASARRRSWTNPCAFESPPTGGGACVLPAPISPATFCNAVAPPPTPEPVRHAVCRRRMQNGFCPCAAAAQRIRDCAWPAGQSGRCRGFVSAFSQFAFARFVQNDRE